jgi:hypothetical protein
MYSAECAAFSLLPGMRQRTRVFGGWLDGEGWSGDGVDGSEGGD